MSPLNTFAMFIAAYLVVFFEASYDGLRRLLGVQVDLLPGLMVYAGLNANIATVASLALVSGLLFDSVSANPLGASVLPLFLVAFVIHLKRDLILRDQSYAQLVLGIMASAACPVLVVLLLLAAGQKPLVGLASVWQWIVMTIIGGLVTPIWFWWFDRFQRAFAYQPKIETPFRPDREIKRGRA
jgi:cell shape-determining protein MreD